MKRIFYLSLMFIALCSPARGQVNRQMSAQNFAGISDVISIPLSDSLPGKDTAREKKLEKSERELATQDSSGAVEKKRYWIEAEYLNWRIKESNLPPLVQIRIQSVPIRTYANLLGGGEVDPGNSGGGRLTAGMWLNKERTVGLEASYFYLGPRSVNQSAGGNGDCVNPCVISNPVIIRPYTTVVPVNALYLISSPFHVRGNVTYSLASHLQGAEFNVLYEPGKRSFRGLRLLAGFRFLDVKERLTIIDTHFHSGANILGMRDAFFLVTDEFTGRNRFYGGQGGVEKEFSLGKLRLELSGKVALGGVRQLVNISGSTFRAFRTVRDTRLGGFLALNTNIGRYERTRLALLPEAKASIGYQFTGNLQAFVGYDFLYISRVARPVEQIDLNINWHNVPYIRVIEGPVIFAGEPSLPEFRFNDSPFWAQGLTVGLRVRF